MPSNLACISPSVVNWRKHVWGIHLSENMRLWLTHRASLTARLQAHCQLFRVQRLHQRAAKCLADEAKLIGLAKAEMVHEREVILRCDEQAVVYAHTVVPLTATAQQWPLFRSLGERSLGSTLFYDPLVHRDALMYARLPRSHPLMRRVIAQGLIDDATAQRGLWARRSVFRRKGGCLLVTEVFLPASETLKPRIVAIRENNV